MLGLTASEKSWGERLRGVPHLHKWPPPACTGQCGCWVATPQRMSSSGAATSAEEAGRKTRKSQQVHDGNAGGSGAAVGVGGSCGPVCY